ncbi:MAG: hypothetical protein SWJ54_22170, partial [Cyanobacteriota bacterium]|nr:hypothetical protein [Cyanobacteriota bacterium]
MSWGDLLALYDFRQFSVVSLHAWGDILVASTYYLILALLIYWVQQRQDFPERRAYLWLGVFLFACGTSKLIDLWTLGQAAQPLAAWIRFILILASV